MINIQDDLDDCAPLLLDFIQRHADAEQLATVLPSWLEIEPVPLREPLVCSWYPCGRHASYVVLGPDYPYCTEHLKFAAWWRVT